MTPAATLDERDARAAVLRAADEVFYAHGVGGTGMAEIRDAAGVSLRRLYGLYPSKRDLTAAWLAARHEAWMAWFTGEVEQRRAAGASAVDAVFDALGTWAASPGYRGCAFLNTAAETAEIDERHRSIIADHKRSLTGYLGELVSAEGRPPNADLARELAVLVDGAIVQSAVLSSVEPITDARRAARRLLG